jgi:plasmid maintenance system antidote protein VapI
VDSLVNQLDLVLVMELEKELASSLVLGLEDLLEWKYLVEDLVKRLVAHVGIQMEFWLVVQLEDWLVMK